MSFLAKLTLGSTEFNVLTAEYEITQSTDAQNRPNGKPRGGIINLTLESSNKNDLSEWMLSPTMKKSGQLTFYRRDANSSMKTIAFSDAFCIYYRESFDASSAAPMRTHIRISAGEMKINNTSVTNPWSSMAAKAKDIADKLGVGNILGGGDNSGGFLNDIMNNSTVQQAYNTTKDTYETGKQAYNTAEDVKNDAESVKNDATKQYDNASKQFDESKNTMDNAGEQISSFIP